MSAAHKCQITFQNHKERWRKIIICGQNMVAVLLWMWVTKYLKSKCKMPVGLWSWYSSSVGRRPSKMTSEMLWFWEFLAGLWFTCAFHVKACHVPVLADLVCSWWTKVCGRKLACKSLLWVPNRGVSVQEMLIIGAGQGSAFSKGLLLSGMVNFPT